MDWIVVDNDVLLGFVIYFFKFIWNKIDKLRLDIKGVCFKVLGIFVKFI